MSDYFHNHKKVNNGFSTASRSERLFYSHYSNPSFNKPQLIFGKESGNEDLWVTYDDRLLQEDYEKHKRAIEYAKNCGCEERTANFYEAYLSAYHEQPINLVWIKAGTNVSNGFEYLIFGYKPK